MACHLGNNRFLHEEKYKDFFTNEPLNLSGAHRLKGGRCIDCHRGIGILDEMKYLFTGEIFDLIKYLNKPNEPIALSMPMADKNCIYCHKDIKKENNGFHYYNAHKGVIPILCVECHIAHDNNMNGGYFFINKEKVLNVCYQCHRGLSKRIKEVLSL